MVEIWWHTKILYVLRTLVGKLIWILIIVGILVVGNLIWILIVVGILVIQWVVRRILGVEMVIVGIHFKTKANRKIKR